MATVMLLVGGIGGWELLLLLALLLILLFGRKLPELTRGLGQGVGEFRKATEIVREELTDALDEKFGKSRKGKLVYEALTHDNQTAEFLKPHPLPEPVSTFILFVAQGFGAGRIPFAPGTFGSVVGMVWFFLIMGVGSFAFYVVAMLLGIACSVWFCGKAEQILKQKDPSSVVLDEIIAVPLCFLPWVLRSWMHDGSVPAPGTFFSPETWYFTLLVFGLFRLFDILKPWPVGASQRLPGGWGITVDDVLAALYVAAILAIVMR